MFGIGFSEIVVIAIVGLIVLGPEKLPKAARFVGLILGKGKRQWQSIKDELDVQMYQDQLRSQVEDVKQVLSVDPHAFLAGEMNLAATEPLPPVPLSAEPREEAAEPTPPRIAPEAQQAFAPAAATSAEPTQAQHDDTADTAEDTDLPEEPGLGSMEHGMHEEDDTYDPDRAEREAENPASPDTKTS